MLEKQYFFSMICFYSPSEIGFPICGSSLAAEAGTKEPHIPPPSPRWRSYGPECLEGREGSLWNHPCPWPSVWLWTDGDRTPGRLECRCGGSEEGNNSLVADTNSICDPKWETVWRFLTFPADSSGCLECWGPGGEEAPWRGRLRETSPGDSTACRSGQRGPWSSLRGQPYLRANEIRRKTRKCSRYKSRVPADEQFKSELASTLHLGWSHHIACRHAGHIDEIDWAVGLKMNEKKFIFIAIPAPLSGCGDCFMFMINAKV